MSYLLVRDGEPPFVLTAENAKGYFDPSAVLTKTRKSSLAMLFRMPKAKKYFGEYLKSHADGRHLLPGDAARGDEQPARARASGG
jgi:hypothetical protein